MPAYDVRTWGVRLFGSVFRRFVTFKAGTNVTITETTSGNEATFEIAASGGGSSAPTGASYVVLGTDATLTAERVLTAGHGVDLVDAGAGSTITVDVDETELSHASLGDRAWASSGHTGTASRIAAFDGGGAAAYLQVGVDVQAYDAGLASLTAADASAGLPYVTGANTWSTATLGDLAVSGGAWTVTDLTIASEAHGDLLYRGASGWVRLAAGTAGRVLTTQGSGAAPTWETLGDLSAGIGDLADLLDGASQPNNECWTEGWGWNGTARVRAWVPTWAPGYKLIHNTIRPDAATNDALGWAGLTIAATSSVGETSGVRYWQSANTGDSSIQINRAATVLELGLVAVVDLTFQTYSDITSIRHMVYVADQSPTAMLGASAPASGSYILLRYDTGAGDTTFQVLCRDGTTTGAAVDTGITPAANTRYSWTLSVSPDASEVQVWMSTDRGARSLVATLDATDNIPASGTALRLAVAAKALSGTKGVRLSSATVIAP